MGCAPPDPYGVADRFRNDLRILYAEAERVQGVVQIAQDGCRAIQHLPEAWWLMRCLEVMDAPSQLTVTLIEKLAWR